MEGSLLVHVPSRGRSLALVVDDPAIPEDRSFVADRLPDRVELQPLGGTDVGPKAAEGASASLVAWSTGHALAVPEVRDCGGHADPAVADPDPVGEAQPEVALCEPATVVTPQSLSH